MTKTLTWAEIDLKALRFNLRQIRKQTTFFRTKRTGVPHSRGISRRSGILAVIKADAYGHGMLKVASVLNREGVDIFGVSDIAEGILLRKNGIKRPILLFESTLPSLARDILEYNLTPTVCTLTLASSLNTHAKRMNRKVDIHVKVDTGMGRLGIWHQDARNFLGQVRKYPHLSVRGLYTHFPLADTNPRFTRKQIMDFSQLIKGLNKEGLSVSHLHAANSAGLMGHSTPFLNLARPGLMLYGLYPDERLKKKITLKPAMSVKCRIIFLKKVSRGRGISYGHTFIAPRDMTVATLPIGYSDGYLRALSSKASVLINGKRCPVLGRVTMDQIIVDVSHVPAAKLGTTVVILGQQKKQKISADELALHAGTINYEIVCSLGNRLPRIYP